MVELFANSGSPGYNGLKLYFITYLAIVNFILELMLILALLVFITVVILLFHIVVHTPGATYTEIIVLSHD